MQEPGGGVMAEIDPTEKAIELPWAPCMAYEFEDEDETPSEGASGAPFYSNLRWKKSELKVHFMNEVPPMWRLLNKAKTPVTKRKVLEWANGWSNEALGLKGIVPQFIEEEDIDESDIRVDLTPTAGSRSHIGTTARDYEGDATIWLNLSAPHDGYREYIVLHEFGHVLGLGHEHQMRQLAGALSKKATIDWLRRVCHMNEKDAKAKFKVDYERYSWKGAPKKGIKFDPWSVMCYPIALECIKDTKKFTPDELKAITSQDYKRRKVLSDVDLITVTNLYSTDKRGKVLKLHQPPPRSLGGVISTIDSKGLSTGTPPSSDEEGDHLKPESMTKGFKRLLSGSGK